MPLGPPYSTIVLSQQGVEGGVVYNNYSDPQLTVVVQTIDLYCNSPDPILGIAELRVQYNNSFSLEFVCVYGTWDITATGVVLQGVPSTYDEVTGTPTIYRVGDITTPDFPYYAHADVKWPVIPVAP